MKIFFDISNKPPLVLSKLDKYRTQILEQQTIRINSFSQLCYTSILKLVLPFYHGFKRKNKIRIMSMEYRIGNSKKHELMFTRYLSGLKGAIAKILYDYTLYECFNMPPFPFDPPVLYIESIHAYGINSKRYNSPYLKECRRMRKIKVVN